MNDEVLRDYQLEMLDRLRAAWTRYQSVMVQMPTGTGKTHLMAEVIKEEMIKCARGGVIIVAHRVELIEQISQTLDAFGVTHGVIDGRTKNKDVRIEEHKVVVASIQKLDREIRYTDSDIEINPSLVIVDEAHHAVAKSYRWMWEKWPEARFLGLTATPCRLNQTGFTDLFDMLLESYPIQEFIDRGWLSDFEYVSVTPDNIMVSRIAGLKKRGVDGDYQTKEMATVMDSPESIGHLYRSYEHYVKGKKGIVYAISREHAQHIAEYYVSKGVRCAVIDAKTPAEERQRTVEAYKNNGSVDVIVNVDIFSEGFDCPDVEFIQLARPTLSLSKYLQQVGRGMRVVPNKDYVVVLDQVGMYQTFGLPTEEREWSLMFRGKTAGKGVHGGDRRYVIRDEPDLTLLNLEMVRIKRHGERCQGVELFVKDGKYGVLKDGNEICAPEFEKVRRLDAPYFAMGIYPYYVFRNRVDIIDMEGHVMRPGLYGNVRTDGDVFIGTDGQGRTDYWDAKGGRHYREKPTFERIERFEVARIGEQMYMRKASKQWEKPFDINSIYLHDLFYVIGNKLIFRNNITQAYEICGYERGLIYIRNREDAYPYASVTRSGRIGSYEKNLPQRLSPRPLDIGMLGMKRFYKKIAV